MDKRFLSVREVSEILGVKKNFIYEEILRGNLPSLKLSQRRTRVAVTDLENYIYSRMPGDQLVSFPESNGREME